MGYVIPSLQMLGCHPSPGWFLSMGSGAGISITDGVGEVTMVLVSMGESTSLSSVSRGGIGMGSDNNVFGVGGGGGVDPLEYGGGISNVMGEGLHTTRISPLVSLVGDSGSSLWKCTRP